MYISSLSLRNFRNFRTAKLLFKDGINTILGENGSGKTNLFYALRLLIDDSLPRYSTENFQPSDFCRALGRWEGHWIYIGVEFAELDVSEEAQAMALHVCGNMDVATEGSYGICYRPKELIRQRLYEYSNAADKNSEGLQEILDAITADDYESKFFCRGTADFSDEETYKHYVGDFEEIVFPNPASISDANLGVLARGNQSIHSEVSCTFIKAMRDVENDLRSYTKNPLLRLLRGKEKTVAIERQKELIADIDSLNSKIDGLEELITLKGGITSSINEAVGQTYAPLINIKSDLPSDIERLFQSLKLWVADAENDGHHGKLRELSLGGANLIYLSLKLLEYEKVKTDRIANFLLIEEPEAHIHTHIQKTLFENLIGKKTQVIVSTHSTHISSASKIRSVNVLARALNESNVFIPSNSLSDVEIGRAERYLDAVRSTLLFAKGVILVEGDAELIVIPALFKAVFGISLDEIGISIINIGSTEFSNVAQLFHPNRIRKNCAILTDKDASVIELPDDPEEDSDLQKDCRNSQISGLEREAKLNNLTVNNPFIKLCFADHTFEIDFLKAGNVNEIKLVVPEIYKMAKHIRESDEKLSGELPVAGLEALRLAKKAGKGWFAILLSEKLDFKTQIPPYILSAIAFASAHINLSCKRKSAEYRIEKFKSNAEHNYYADAIAFDPAKETDEEFINSFLATFPKDTLTIFIGEL